MKAIAKMALCAVIVAGAISGDVFAEATAYPIPGETRLVTFRYHKDQTYPIAARPGTHTDIQLSPDETLSAFAIGDQVRWVVNETLGHVFVKPVQPGLFTSATLVTNKRTYQLTLRSSPEDGAWYQRVSWEYPGILVLGNKRVEQVATNTQQGNNGMAVQPSRLNFTYKVEGPNASYRPTQVFDDGKFTWIALPEKNQELPAVFVISEDGAPALANFIVKGRYLVVQRLFPEAVLKLGETEVRIVNNAYPGLRSARSWWDES